MQVIKKLHAAALSCAMCVTKIKMRTCVRCVCLFKSSGLGWLVSSTFRKFSLLSTPYCEDGMYLWMVGG